MHRHVPLLGDEILCVLEHEDLDVLGELGDSLENGSTDRTCLEPGNTVRPDRVDLFTVERSGAQAMAGPAAPIGAAGPDIAGFLLASAVDHRHTGRVVAVALHSHPLGETVEVGTLVGRERELRGPGVLLDA